jgi:hypothetical protein
MSGEITLYERFREVELGQFLSGRAIVFTTHKELAELKREQVHAYGPDFRMSNSLGPIRCEIEPAA